MSKLQQLVAAGNVESMRDESSWGTSVAMKVPVSKIRLDETQPKVLDMKNPDHVALLNSLIKDLKRRGLLYPVLLTPFTTIMKNGTKTLVFGKDVPKQSDYEYWVLDGHKRVQAFRKLSWKEIDAIVKTEIDFDTMQEIQFVTAARGISLENYNGVELARAIRRHISTKMQKYPSIYPTENAAIRKLAELTNYSVAFFLGRLDILEAPPEVQNMIETNKISNKNIVTEIKNATRDHPEMMPYAYKRVTDNKVNSTLEMRPAAKMWGVIDRLEDKTPAQKTALKKKALDWGGRDPTTIEDRTITAEDCVAQLNLWIGDMSAWPVSTFNITEMNKINQEVTRLHSMWRNLKKKRTPAS